jgi:hypothetical protein
MNSKKLFILFLVRANLTHVKVLSIRFRIKPQSPCEQKNTNYDYDTYSYDRNIGKTKQTIYYVLFVQHKIF